MTYNEKESSVNEIYLIEAKREVYYSSQRRDLAQQQEIQGI